MAALAGPARAVGEAGDTPRVSGRHGGWDAFFLGGGGMGRLRDSVIFGLGLVGWGGGLPDSCGGSQFSDECVTWSEETTAAGHRAQGNRA